MIVLLVLSIVCVFAGVVLTWLYLDVVGLVSSAAAIVVQAKWLRSTT
ncbi:MAG: hypothetical protein ACYDEY_01700 [Acidimicrobiales bacterium]